MSEYPSYKGWYDVAVIALLIAILFALWEIVEVLRMTS